MQSTIITCSLTPGILSNNSPQPVGIKLTINCCVLHMCVLKAVHFAIIDRAAMLRVTIVATISLQLLQADIINANKESTPEQLGIYYDLRDGVPLHFAVEGNLGGGAGRRVSNRSNGCSCQAMTCGCCTGINIQQVNFNREGCMNFTYDPNEFSVIMNMFMNDNPIYTNTLSAKNPPPLCLPFGVPYLPRVEFCARLFDLHTQGSNLQMCLDLETRVQAAPVFVLHFDCMRMGAAGVALVKPGDELPPTDEILPVEPLPPPPQGPQSVGILTNPFATTTSTPLPQSVTDVDVYDEVIEAR